MTNYKQAKIYKIVCNKTGLVYVGATCKPLLCQRLAKHVSDHKQHLNGKCGYTTSFKIIENDDYFIELIEQKECNSKDELNKLEGKFIREIECVNKVIPDRTLKEYRQANKDKIKEYYQNNKEKINQKFTCQCGSKYRHSDKVRHEKSKKHNSLLHQQNYNLIGGIKNN